MPYENKPDTGVLFKNRNKKTENHPDYTGTWYAEGENGEVDEYWLSAWINTPKSGGDKFMKLALGELKPKQEQAPAGNMSDGSTDEDVPF